MESTEGAHYAMYNSQLYDNQHLFSYCWGGDKLWLTGSIWSIYAFSLACNSFLYCVANCEEHFVLSTNIYILTITTHYCILLNLLILLCTIYVRLALDISTIKYYHLTVWRNYDWKSCKLHVQPSQLIRGFHSPHTKVCPSLSYYKNVMIHTYTVT